MEALSRCSTKFVSSSSSPAKPSLSSAKQRLVIVLPPMMTVPPLPLSCPYPPFTVPCKMVLARPDERETCTSVQNSVFNLYCSTFLAIGVGALQIPCIIIFISIITKCTWARHLHFCPTLPNKHLHSMDTKKSMLCHALIWIWGCYCKILRISYKDRVTNEEVCAKIQQAVGPHEDLLTNCISVVLFPVHQVWSKPSFKAQ